VIALLSFAFGMCIPVYYIFMVLIGCVGEAISLLFKIHRQILLSCCRDRMMIVSSILIIRCVRIMI